MDFAKDPLRGPDDGFTQEITPDDRRMRQHPPFVGGFGTDAARNNRLLKTGIAHLCLLTSINVHIACELSERLISIGERAKAARLHLEKSQQEMADLLGLSVRAWQKMERDEGVPSGETLLRFNIVKINPGWILTGSGEMLNDLSKASRHTVSLDAVLMEKLARIVTSVYREAGSHKLSGEKITVEATALYNDLVGRGVDLKDTELIETILPQLRLELKRRLEQAEAEPGLGKRSA